MCFFFRVENRPESRHGRGGGDDRTHSMLRKLLLTYQDETQEPQGLRIQGDLFTRFAVCGGSTASSILYGVLCYIRRCYRVH